MAELNPDTWSQSHMRLMALSRWDNDGGAVPSRLTAAPTSRRQAQLHRLSVSEVEPAKRALRQPGLSTLDSSTCHVSG